MRIATAAYNMTPLRDFNEYRNKLTDWVSRADADLLVFPEYGAMELATISGQAGDLEASLRAVSDLIPMADALHSDLATQFKVHILAASAPVFAGGARPVNRARFFAPSGAATYQDKQIVTPFERDTWNVVPGDPLTVFDTAIGRLAVLICYDAEFPMLARALIEAGAEVLLVPSCTDTPKGYNRVRIGAMARALEGQCAIVHSPTVGPCDWSLAVDENHGAAAIYAPPDGTFPNDGVVAQGKMNRPGWTHASIDVEALAQLRDLGAVRSFAHWSEQTLRLSPVRQVRLS